MRLAAIVALSENFVIGKDNALPWHVPADLQHFKQLTWGKSILMGRKTFDSIGHALPGRQNIVISRDRNFQASDCLVVHSIEVALDSVTHVEEVLVIGGAQLYQQLLPYLQRLYLTIIHHTFSGDTFFPTLHLNDWNEIERIDHKADMKNLYDYSFITLERKK